MATCDGASARNLWPGIIGKDERVIVDESGQPWDAIGHVNIGGYRSRSQCTGTIVAPDLVLTAAHCVMDFWKKRSHPPHNIHFLPAVPRENRKGHATAKCLLFQKDYPFTDPGNKITANPRHRLPLHTATKDVVAIVLKKPIAVEPAPLAAGVVPQPGLRLVHAAYFADRRFRLSAHYNCQILRADLVGPLWFNDCDTHHSSSGGPVFTEMDGRLKLAAIMIGGLPGRKANIAVPISEWIALTKKATCSE